MVYFVITIFDYYTVLFYNSDGYDMTSAIAMNVSSPRKSILLDLYDKREFVFQEESMAALRSGDWKIIDGTVRDPHWYYESKVTSRLVYL